jgi:hypothetical protein
MDQLEKAFCLATRGASKAYEDITGYWLWHSPEHFLQYYVMLRLGKEYTVHAESTRKRIELESGMPYKGRPPTDHALRYDLVIWHKATPSVRAVVEIKRCYGEKGTVLKKDGVRIKNACKGANRAKHGYLLVYSEKRLKEDKSALLGVFDHWASSLDLGMVKCEILNKKGPDNDDKPWESGYCLLKANGTIRG